MQYCPPALLVTDMNAGDFVSLIDASMAWWTSNGMYLLLHKNLYFKDDFLEIYATMWQLFKEFLVFLRQEKKWWLTPLVVVLLLLAAVIVFTGGSVLAPLMYPFM